MSEVYLMISAGSGPRECAWAAQKVTSAFAREAANQRLAVAILTDDDAAASYFLRVSGAQAEAFAQARIGTIKWVGQSPFRKNHKRKNWYVSVSRAPNIADIPELLESDIRYQTLKASGPGGQHVNATESAVRATHIPSSVSVSAREERSQHANKKLCKAKLAVHFLEKQARAEAGAKTAEWQAHQRLERGNEIRVYCGEKFKLETR